MLLLGIDFEGNDGERQVSLFRNKKFRIRSGNSGTVIKD